MNIDRNLTTNMHTVASDGNIFVVAEHSFGDKFLLKLGKQNNILWSRFLQLPDTFIGVPDPGGTISAIAAMPDSGFAICGYVQTGDLIDNMNMFVMRFDKNGNTIWSRMFEFGRSEHPGAMLIKDTVIHIAGIGISFQAMPSDVFHARIGFSGKLISYATRMAGIEREVRGMNISPNGWVCITSESFLNNKNQYGFVDIVDPGGNFRWHYSLKDIADNIFPEQVQVSGNSFIVTGTAYDDVEPVKYFIMQFDIGFIGSNLQADFYTLSASGPSSVYPLYSGVITKSTDNEFYIGGVAGHNLLWDQRVFLANIHLTADHLTIEWAKTYGDDTYQHIRTLHIRNGSALTAVGSAQHSMHANDVYLLETDLKGDLACHKEELDIAVEKRTVHITGELAENRPVIYSEIDYGVTTSLVTFLYYENLCQLIAPVAGFAITDSLICAGESISIGDTSKYAATFKWYFEGTQPADYDKQHPPVLKFSAPGIYKLVQVVANALGSDTATCYVTVANRPIGNAGNDRQLCLGHSITLEAGGGSAYEWYDNGQLINLNGSPTVNVSPGVSQHYMVVALGELGCRDTDEVYVKVITPLVSAGGYDTLICEGDAVTLTMPSYSGLRYKWSTGDTSSSIRVKEAGIYTVSVSNECFTRQAAFTVSHYDCSLRWHTPNAFTPNADSLNDVFTITGQNIAHIQLSIYNRWGERIYIANGPATAWDGRFKGHPAPEGIYSYIITVKGIKGEKQYRTGTFHLLR